MRVLVAGLVLLFVLPSIVRGQSPAGTEFQVNTYTTSPQSDAAVASDGSGNFVVVWHGAGNQDGDYFGVFGQRFSASGLRQGDEFRVNTYTTSGQYAAAVASDANGNFVVVWESGGDHDGSGRGIFGQRFDAAGVLRGAEFRINSYTTGFQFGPAVAADAGGNFVVVWMSAQNGYAFGVFGQRFDASGAPLGSEFEVSNYTTSYQVTPSVAADADGDFVVVWSGGQDDSLLGVFGRRFDAAGVPQGSEFQANTYTTDKQYQPAVAMDPDGNFVVVWESGPFQESDTLPGFGVFGQGFDATGARRGSEFHINTYTTGPQRRPVVAADENGSFVVAWHGQGQGASYGVFGQRFDGSGTRQGSEFQVNASAYGPAVASSPDGDFVVAWTGSDGDSAGVFGQRYGDIIFEDGFDSDSLARWSSAATDGSDLSAGAASAMAGTPFGLQALVNDTHSLYVQDDTPSAENRYRARFYLDTNGFDPGEASFHFRTRIFLAFDPSGLRVITIVLKRQAGAYSIGGRVRRNDGTRADTGFFPITDGPHFVEFDWRRSTAPGASNGALQLWIDGGSVATLSGVDNDFNPVEFVRLGALALKTGAAGALYYDQFESRRERLIGPE
jgi:hypothetical protein